MSRLCVPIVVAALGIVAGGCKDPENGLFDIPDDNTHPDPDVDTDIGVTDPNAPIALCSATPNPVQPPFETATLDGTESYDPNGEDIVEYEWELISDPPGNTEVIESPTAAIAMFTPLLAGNYFIDLTVKNTSGIRSAPCSITLEAVPVENLWVEMFWSQAEDIDLHLVKPGGTYGIGSSFSGDCHWTNCKNGLNWGNAAESYDDPTLDLDDITGTGPENINIENPYGGTYTVYVHDYPWTSDPTSATAVTVNLYLGGTQVYTHTERMTGEGDVEPIVAFDPSSGMIQPL